MKWLEDRWWALIKLSSCFPKEAAVVNFNYLEGNYPNIGIYDTICLIFSFCSLFISNYFLFMLFYQKGDCAHIRIAAAELAGFKSTTDQTAIPIGSYRPSLRHIWKYKAYFFPVWLVRTNYLELTEVELQSDRIFCNNRKQLLCIDMHGLYCVFTSVILLSINVLTLIRFLSRTAHQLSSYN